MPKSYARNSGGHNAPALIRGIPKGIKPLPPISAVTFEGIPSSTALVHCKSSALAYTPRRGAHATFFAIRAQALDSILHGQRLLFCQRHACIPTDVLSYDTGGMSEKPPGSFSRARVREG